ncbi:MAG TPA: hypothetical protein VF719_13645 [Abditibacteriaceae bacterium]|jgi:predicted PurR-regulated permease PerM
MIKIILLLILLMVAYGIAIILLRRLSQTTQQLANLRSEMRRNDEKLSAKIEVLQAQKAAQEAQAPVVQSAPADASQSTTEKDAN